MTTVLGAVFALISAVAAASAWVIQYDQRLRLETLEQRSQSLQGTVGNLKQTVRRDAQKIVREEIEAGNLEANGSSGAGEMQSVLLQMMMANGGMGGLQGASEFPDQSHANGQSSERPPGMLGRGGRPEVE